MFDLTRRFIAYAGQLQQVWDEGGKEVRTRFSKYVRQVRRNPHLFCYNECCMDGCPKHKDKCPYDGQYLIAMLKDTPICPYEDIATYEYE